MTEPSKAEFLDRSSFEERKAWTIDNVQAYFVEAAPANSDTLEPVYVLLCSTAVPPLITPGERAQAEYSKFPAVTVCVISGTRVGTERRIFAQSHEEALHWSYLLPVPLLNT